MLTVLALGGNALLRPGERGTAAEHRANLAATFAAVAPLLEGEVVVTHGNGPQVGNELLRQELGAAEAPPLPLWVAVAQTQAEIGALAAAELIAAVAAAGHGRRHPRRASIRTTRRFRTRRSRSDRTTPATGRASSSRSVAGRSRRSPAGGWRRVVPSPRPLEVIELDAVRTLLEAGQLVVAVGGGGIPVVRRGRAFDGIDAVIDKDHASALLAVGLGAERLVILTQVPGVYRDFGARRGRAASRSPS